MIKSPFLKTMFAAPALRCAISVLMLAATTVAANLTGNVTNKTSNKPSAGDDVVILKLSQGMQEAGHTKTDPKGNFTLPVPDDRGQHLVRVTHQGVNYFKPAPMGTTSVDVEVYDAGKQVQGVAGRADIMRVQTENSQLEVTEMFVIQNNSNPPKTQMSDRSFEFALPEGAIVDGSLAAGPGGMPVNSAPVPTGSKNHYAFVFPIRPGETRFQVSYHLPYSGSFAFQPQIVVPMEDVVVMLPKSMDFKGDASQFAGGGEEKGMSIFVAHNVAAGKQMAFSVSGTGQIPREAQDDNTQGQQTEAAQNQPDNRPGGGLGRPEDTPDPLHAYRWWIIGGLAAALVVGAIVVINQKPRTPSVTSAAAATAAAGSITATGPQSQVPNRDTFLQAMKEELFQLETERLQGKISDADYQQAKAALDLTIKRALKRQAIS
ncbi:MAG TPA: hypothetical protein VJR04_01665 [Terriglobales bacterium]|nr:hypothetical protein [Terriglobales bacterium]